MAQGKLAGISKDKSDGRERYTSIEEEGLIRKRGEAAKPTAPFISPQ